MLYNRDITCHICLAQIITHHWYIRPCSWDATWDFALILVHKHVPLTSLIATHICEEDRQSLEMWSGWVYMQEHMMEAWDLNQMNTLQTNCVVVFVLTSQKDPVLVPPSYLLRLPRTAHYHSPHPCMKALRSSSSGLQTSRSQKMRILQSG